MRIHWVSLAAGVWILLSPLSHSRASESREWFACKTVQDCVLVEDFCSWRAVNKNFVKAFQAGHVNSYECTTPTPPPGSKAKFGTICMNSLCQRVPVSNTAPPDPEAECRKKGGRWEGSESGRGRLSGCNLPTKDGGKSCTRGEDCESVCLTDGTCSPWTEFKGCAHFKGHSGAYCIE